jgi:hypothetical protein
VSAEQFPALRQKPGPVYGQPPTAAFLKHLDEQTLAGLAAVFQAIHDHSLGTTSFADWGILAAPRFLGRANLAVALHRFQLEGAWGISPHLIPHHSLHSLSGTVSQALHCHGPNFGVGGGPHAAEEGILTAAALLAGDQVPGVWLILTGFYPEQLPQDPSKPAPGGNGHAAAGPVCGATALALVGSRPGSPCQKLQVAPAAKSAESSDPARPLFSLEAFLTALTDPRPAGGSSGWRLRCGGWVDLKRHEAGAEN